MRLIFCAQIGEAGRDICESFLKVTWLLALQIGLSRLCSATLEQLFAVLATSSKFCLSEQFLSKILV